MKIFNFSGIDMYEESKDYLITLGDIWLFKENNKQQSNCLESSSLINYYGIEKALCGKQLLNYNKNEYFIPKRILVIQMK